MRSWFSRERRREKKNMWGWRHLQPISAGGSGDGWRQRSELRIKGTVRVFFFFFFVFFKGDALGGSWVAGQSDAGGDRHQQPEILRAHLDVFNILPWHSVTAESLPLFTERGSLCKQRLNRVFYIWIRDINHKLHQQHNIYPYHNLFILFFEVLYFNLWGLNCHKHFNQFAILFDHWWLNQ